MRAVLLALLLIPHAHADSGDTLRLVRARGMLRCGVSEGITGFSARTEAGWRITSRIEEHGYFYNIPPNLKPAPALEATP